VLSARPKDFIPAGSQSMDSAATATENGRVIKASIIDTLKT